MNSLRVPCMQVFLTPDYLAIAMEYASGGDMFQFVKNRRGLPVTCRPSHLSVLRCPGSTPGLCAKVGMPLEIAGGCVKDLSD